VQFHRWSPMAWAVAMLSLGVAATATGQVSDTTSRQLATVLGQVVDSSGAGIGDAEVLVLVGDQPAVAPSVSDSQGHYGCGLSSSP
jgi:hypothetical protein